MQLLYGLQFLHMAAILFVAMETGSDKKESAAISPLRQSKTNAPPKYSTEECGLGNTPGLKTTRIRQ